MRYSVEFKPRALKDLQSLSPLERARVVGKIEAMQNDLAGAVKRLTNFTPEYRLRVGDYRVLFEIERKSGEAAVVIYRVLPRRDAYRGA